MSEVSNCHQAPMHIGGDDIEGTHYYVCNECDQLCDPATLTSEQSDELDAEITRIFVTIDNYGTNVEARQGIRDLIAHHTKEAERRARQQTIKDVLALPDMQIERPLTRSNTSARHARNKLREERLMPAITELAAPQQSTSPDRSAG